jgi:prolyl 4-hydroxylase
MPFTVPDFAAPEECARLVDLARPRLALSTVAAQDGANKLDPVRSGRLAFLNDALDPLVCDLSHRIARLLELPDVTRFEDFQVLCYGLNEQYEPHFDAFPLTWTPWIQHGGQRVATAILGLIAPEEGGETVFPDRDERYPVVPGQLLVFANVLEDERTPNPLSRHGGAPVIRGEKWVVTKWVRQGRFR